MPKKKQPLVPTRATMGTPRLQNHAYLREDGSVDGNKLLDVVKATPGAFDLMILKGFLDGGHIARKYDDMAEEIVRKLLAVILLAGRGVEQ